MQTVLIANPKGGSGKTTLSVNVAGYLAAHGKRTAILDLDRQQSASLWLQTRSDDLPPITPLGDKAPGKELDWLVIDSPAGLHGKNLSHALKLANKILIPVAPSMFDLHASRDFLQALAAEKTVRKQRNQIGIIGMRMDPRTRAAQALEHFLASLDLPVVAYLRETQVYVNAAFEGKSLFDLPPYLAERELEQWDFLEHWLAA